MYYHFLLWFLFARKILKVSWQGNTLNLLVIISRYCYYVFATVFEINFIYTTARLNSMVNCQTPAILALFFTFNCDA